MKPIFEWNPAALLQSRLFLPLHPLLQQLSAAEFPDLAALNALQANNSEIRVNSGHLLRFVEQQQGKQVFAAQYEPRCYLSGELQTRRHNWHDLYNALVWLTFPRAKAALNERHYHALTGLEMSAGSQRGRVRDMATLFDESGVVVASSDESLLQMLRDFQWKDLFWQQRQACGTQMEFSIFGHGLYEKAMQPYIGMTGQGLLLKVPSEYFAWDDNRRMQYLDAAMADYIAAPGHCLSTRELNPVPLLGIPGWWAENADPRFYDNTGYFRAGRRPD